jgi:EAL domain-containing protein (putative c-di-GMP-specific phosphodiesterase class I)
MRVLIVDHDRFARMVLARQLRTLGITALQGRDTGSAALRTIAAGGAFDVVFVDLDLPDMDGVEFLRRLADLGFGGALLLVSSEDERILAALTRVAAAHRLRAHGLRKPVTRDALRDALGREGAMPSTDARGDAAAVAAADLAGALTDDQLVNHYQPQVDLDTGALAGVEALVRWQHPRAGLLPPARFVGAFEANGLAAPLAHRVLARALADARAWSTAGLALRVSVNVSLQALLELAFPDAVEAIAADAGFACSQLVLEIAERAVARETRVLVGIAHRLRGKGIALAIDDFGSGEASVAQLRDLPFDELKLDRSCVHGAATTASRRALLAPGIEFARRQRVRCVAEGVEEARDRDCLRTLGCDLAQGFLFARPMSASQLPDWARSWHGGPQQTVYARH